MPKKILKLMLTLTLSFIFIQPLYAASTKFIRLKDGSVLKGKVIEMSGGTYKIETPHLGIITLPENEIISISESNSAAQGDTSEKANIKKQVQQIKGDVLSNPAIMKEITNMTQNPEIMQLLSDPNLINDVMSYDPEKIESNPKIQQLMNNPDMQKLMNQLSGQLSQ
ncbi:hypothetical protein MNBD_UNCLBAC01-1302 [hydrothermal vent metagenome]|uniref:STI1 domain-containing protein n=1 Tax=hydrothermal vent metagenome TaxID=652676 RepID=A0A3B1DLA3_9ZZZZ